MRCLKNIPYLFSSLYNLAKIMATYVLFTITLKSADKYDNVTDGNYFDNKLDIEFQNPTRNVGRHLCLVCACVFGDSLNAILVAYCEFTVREWIIVIPADWHSARVSYW